MSDYPLLPTSLVGSYAQPDWLIDKSRLGARLPPRVLLHELWKPRPRTWKRRTMTPPSSRCNDQHRAGVDIVH